MVHATAWAARVRELGAGGADGDSLARLGPYCVRHFVSHALEGGRPELAQEACTSLGFLRACVEGQEVGRLVGLVSATEDALKGRGGAAAMLAETRGWLRTFAGLLGQCPDRAEDFALLAPPETWVHRAAAGRRWKGGGGMHVVRGMEVLPNSAVLQGHARAITKVLFSPDGLTLATASSDATVRLWDGLSGAVRSVLRRHKAQVSDAAFSPDGAVLASASWDCTLCLWDATSGEHRHTLQGHSGRVSCVCFHPLRPLLASGSDDHMVRLWSAETGEALRALDGSKERVTCLAFSAGGQHLAAGSEDTTVRVWAADGAALVRAIPEHRQVVSNVVFIDDATLATASWDQAIGITRLPDGALVTREAHQDSVSCLVYERACALLISASWDRRVSFWKLGPVGLTQALGDNVAHRGEVNAVAVSADGNVIATASQDRTIQVWQVRPKLQMLHELRGHKSAVSSVVFGSDWRRLVSGAVDGSVRMWDLQATRRQDSDTSFHLRAAAVSCDGSLVATGFSDGRVVVWDAAMGKVVSEKSPADAAQGGAGCHQGAVTAVAFCPVPGSPTGFLVSTSWDNTAIVWNPAQPNKRATLSGHADGVTLLATAEGAGGLFATASPDRVARTWDAATFQPVAACTGHTKAITALTLSRTGEMVACGSEDTSVRVWAARTGVLLGALAGHAAVVRSLTFSPDASLLASGSADRAVHLWSVADRRLVGSLEGHQATVQVLAFSADGARLGSGAADGSVWLWDVASKTAVAEHGRHARKITGLRFDEATDTLTSYSESETMRVWDRDGRQVDEAALDAVTLAWHGDSMLVLAPRGHDPSAVLIVHLKGSKQACDWSDWVRGGAWACAGTPCCVVEVL